MKIFLRDKRTNKRFPTVECDSVTIENGVLCWHNSKNQERGYIASSENLEISIEKD